MFRWPERIKILFIAFTAWVKLFRHIAWNRRSWKVSLIIMIITDHFYIALLSALEQTHCARMWLVSLIHHNLHIIILNFVLKLKKVAFSDLNRRWLFECRKQLKRVWSAVKKKTDNFLFLLHWFHKLSRSLDKLFCLTKCLYHGSSNQKLSFLHTSHRRKTWFSFLSLMCFIL